MTFRAWWLLVGMLIGALAGMLDAQPRVVTLAIGRINPTEQEQQECVFPIGQGAAILLHPEGEFCQIAREQIGKTGTLLFVPD